MVAEWASCIGPIDVDYNLKYNPTHQNAVHSEVHREYEPTSLDSMHLVNKNTSSGCDTAEDC